jgi:hypothetical protein
MDRLVLEFTEEFGGLCRSFFSSHSGNSGGVVSGFGRLCGNRIKVIPDAMPTPLPPAFNFIQGCSPGGLALRISKIFMCLY